MAIAFREWLPDVLQSVSPFMSSEDIPKGARWATQLHAELREAVFAIICVTSENCDKPWLNYEAGALSNALTDPRVCPLLLDVRSADIEGPLATFQMADITEADVRRLVTTINAESPMPLTEAQLERAFNRSWNELETQIQAIRVMPTQQKTVTHRPIEELAQETLDAIREQSRTLTEVLESVRQQSSAQAITRSIGEIPRALLNLKPGDVVKHSKWGQGEVMFRPIGPPNENLVTIKFPTVGLKLLMLKYAPLELIATKEEVEEIKREHVGSDIDSDVCSSDDDDINDVR